MGQRGEGVDGLAVEQNVELGQFRRAIAVDMIVERGVALGDALQLVVEIDDDLAQRYHEMELHTVARHILLTEQLAAFVQAQAHDGTDEIGAGDDGGTNIGLLNMVDERRLGKTTGVVHFLAATLLVVNHIRHVGHGGDDIHIKLAVEAFLHNLHVEQSKEATTETKAQGL